MPNIKPISDLRNYRIATLNSILAAGLSYILMVDIYAE